MDCYADKFRDGCHRQRHLLKRHHAVGRKVDIFAHKAVTAAGKKAAALGIIFIGNTVIPAGNVGDEHDFLASLKGACAIPYNLPAALMNQRHRQLLPQDLRIPPPQEIALVRMANRHTFRADDDLFFEVDLLIL